MAFWLKGVCGLVGTDEGETCPKFKILLRRQLCKVGNLGDFVR